MGRRIKILSGLLGVLYPFIVYVGLKRFNTSPRILGFLIAAMGIVYFMAYTDRKNESLFSAFRFWGMIIIVTLLSILTLISESTGYVKLYPVIINLMLLLSFGSTLIKGPSMIFRFALLQDKSLEQSETREAVVEYCRRVTVVWILFFLINGVIASMTVVLGSDELWTLYNGLISYLLMGAIFLIEFIIRKKVAR